MSRKNDTPVLIGALLVTAALISLGLWWLFSRFDPQLGGMIPSNETSSSADPSAPTASNGIPAVPTAQSFAEVQNVPSGLFNYGGSTTWAPIRGSVDPVIQQVYPTFQLRYTNPLSGAPGSTTGIQMLIDGQLSFAQSSRSLKPEELQAAQQRGFTLKEIPVALEGIAIAVHPDLNLSGLTLNQLRDIYTGQITNWNQVGGPNLAITAYSRRPEEGGTVEFFVDNVMGSTDFGRTVQFIATTTEALRAVSTSPGGIYYASAPEVIRQCTTKPLPIGQTPGQLVAPYQLPLIPPDQCPAQRNQINSDALQSGEYPITRRLLVIVKEDGQIDQQAGEAYAQLLLSQQGQELLSQAGFVRIR